MLRDWKSAWLAPPIFLCHFLEEGTRFLAWLNLRADPDMSVGSFYAINAVALLVTVALAAAAVAGGRWSALLFLGWLGFLMLGNGILRLLATVYFAEYCPGSVTAALLYLPYFAWMLHRVRTRLGVAWGRCALATLFGALPMLAQGYAVLVMGRRLLW